MKRSTFLKLLFLSPFIGSSMNLKSLKNITDHLPATEPMPVLFLGHGNPMNAILENEYVQGFRDVAKKIPKPQLILCVSAHWETNGTKITAMQKPPTIHDFGGFPQALFDVQYPAPGSPEWAEHIQKIVKKTNIELDLDWGLDHGAWSVIKHLYPEADVPVLELSIDYTKSPKYHFELAQELQILRRKGVLIIGSGNIVHNLRMVDWTKMNDNFGFDWAIEANDRMKNMLINHQYEQLINFHQQGIEFQMAIPTPEHYIPLLYSIALRTEKDELTFFNDSQVGGSLSMTSVLIK